ncbi:nuclear transport factor 2 family protein [Pendulispora albinea]|uniref:Nuclear transport factor 2 family protein n=1 Tax=Pendulispora albinea TaxID=2741071 RepID=A0ABZ2M343_9BACT
MSFIWRCSGAVALLLAAMITLPCCTNDDSSSEGRMNDDQRRNAHREAIRSYFSRLEAFDIAGAVDLFAEDGVQTMPYAPADLLPPKLEGRAAISRQYSGMPTNFVYGRYPDLVIHDMVDPDRLFVTFRGDIELRAGGRYDNTYAGVFIFQGEKIIEYIEYFDPIVFRNAFGPKGTAP